MIETRIENSRETISLISYLCKVARFCRQDSVLCEDLTLIQFLILDAVSKRGELRMSDLHQILAVDKSTTTRLVTPLIKRNLVERTKSANDLRAVNLSLTGEGKEIHQRVSLCLAGLAETIRAGIPEEKRIEVYRAVELFLGAVHNAITACKCDEPPLLEIP
jgi:DNA-binding MarR family transcriptional regulator